MYADGWTVGEPIRHCLSVYACDARSLQGALVIQLFQESFDTSTALKSDSLCDWQPSSSGFQATFKTREDTYSLRFERRLGH